MKMSIIYWSGTGNTSAMADAIAEGAAAAGAEVNKLEVSSASLNDILEADVVALGCPAMGAEVLEESEFEPFYQSIRSNLSGRKIGLFGSYGWGDGEWMRNWHDDAAAAGAVFGAEDLMVCGALEGGECSEFGKALTK